MYSAVLIPIASSLAGGIIVALANHFLTKNRDERKRKDDIRTAYLIDAWKNIEKASNLEGRSDEHINSAYDKLEDSIASVILLGSKHEAELAMQLAVDMSKGPGADSTPLLNGLRGSLRAELGLEVLDKMTVFVRMRRRD